MRERANSSQQPSGLSCRPLTSGIDSAVGHRLSAGCLRGRNPSNSTFNAPNGDGIDIDSSTNAHVHSSIIDAADDALCIKAGADWLGRHVNRPTENVLFENIEVRLAF